MKYKLVIMLIMMRIGGGFPILQGMGFSTSANVDTLDLTMKLDAYIKQYTDLDIFSGVVLIASDGEPMYHKPFGLANREKGIPVTLDSKFLIGSMNKSFTQVVILQLLMEGKLALQDKLVDHLDGFQQPMANQITIEQLLNHRSGFGDYHGPVYFDLPYEKKNIPGITAILKHSDLNFLPGSEEQYSNAGYILLGAIIEKVTGKTYAVNVDERIIQSIGLSETYTAHIDRVPNRTIGYLKTIVAVENNLDFITEPRSDGGFWSTASDILSFYRNFLYGEKLLTDKMKDSMTFFKQLNQVPKGKAIGMAGGMNGINTVLMEMPNEKVSIVVLANMDEPVAEQIASGIKEILNGGSPKKAIKPVKLRVYDEYSLHGIHSVKKNFDELTFDVNPHDEKDRILNSLGYELLQTERVNEALEVFQLNTELFPNLANCWDSYGEALLKSGNKTSAEVAYKKALHINPNMQSARNALEMLERK